MRLSILLLIVLSISSLKAYYDVKKIRTIHGLHYQLNHQRFLMVYAYGKKLTREEYNILTDTCNKKPFSTGGFRVLAVPFDGVPEFQKFFDDHKITTPGTGVIFVDGDPIPGSYFTEDLSYDRLDSYLVSRIGDDVETFLQKPALEDHSYAWQGASDSCWNKGDKHCSSLDPYATLPRWGASN